MVFSSTLFLFYFLPFFLVVYHVVPKSFKNWVLLFFSLLFYAWGAPVFVFVLLSTAIIDFYLVKLIHEREGDKQRRILLFLSVALKLGLLIYFKYFNFFIENVSVVGQWFGFEEIHWVNIVLPIGISFFIFESITYSVDVYRRIHAPLTSLRDYLIYLLAFPKLIAGPIVRFQEIADEVRNRTETIDEKLIGFYRFCIGLGKKVLIANVMAAQVQEIYQQDFNQMSATTAWIGMFAYTMQIYFDFSGYSDMALGLGKIMGFHFPENFDNPYTSRSITEFWRRWHITLGSFMRNYLYIPLGGNRVSVSRLYFNLILVFMLSGLWHGASWNFVFWGVYHGLFLVLDRLFLKSLLEKLGPFVSIPVTFLLVMIGWVFFSIEDLGLAMVYLSRLIDFNSFDLLVVQPGFWTIGCVALFFSFFTLSKQGAAIQQVVFSKNTYSLATHGIMIVMAVVLFLFSVSAVISSGFNPFIYFRF